MKTQEDRVTERLQKAFTTAHGEQYLTPEQVIAIVKFSKLVRFRARNNSALKFLCSRVFGKMGFKTHAVTKQSDNGESFDAIVCEKDGVTAEEYSKH